MAGDVTATWTGKGITLSLDHVDGVPVAALAGEFDPDTVGEVDRFLRRNLGPLFFKRNLVIDLAGVAFIDSSFITLLISLVRRFQAEHAELVLARPAGGVRRVLAVVGLPNLVPVYEGVGDAVGALKGRVAPLIPPPFDAGPVCARVARA
jgi:anti-sigma B factor antagonist